jgi:hypothetical protein
MLRGSYGNFSEPDGLRDKGKLISFPSLSQIKEGPVGGTQQALANQ